MLGHLRFPQRFFGIAAVGAAYRLWGVKEITKKLRECAAILHDKAEKLDDAHRNEQIAEIAEDLKAHSKEIEQLAERIRGRVK